MIIEWRWITPTNIIREVMERIGDKKYRITRDSPKAEPRYWNVKAGPLFVAEFLVSKKRCTEEDRRLAIALCVVKYGSLD